MKSLPLFLICLGGKCNVCSRYIAVKSKLEEHEKAHADGTIFLCDICPYGYIYEKGA